MLKFGQQLAIQIRPGILTPFPWGTTAWHGPCNNSRILQRWFSCYNHIIASYGHTRLKEFCSRVLFEILSTFQAFLRVTNGNQFILQVLLLMLWIFMLISFIDSNFLTVFII